MKLYRIEKTKYANHWPFDGSLYSNGRWHRIGMWVIDTSQSESLARSEVLVNANKIPKNRVLVIMEIDEKASITNIPYDQLPGNWSKFPPPLQLAKITRKFLQQERHLALRVPSTQSLTEFNYVLNPAHPDFGRFVQKVGLMEINFDPSLGGK